MNGPVRTCVGCRGRAEKSALLRVVARAGAVVVDPQQRLSGRGAYLHPETRCLELARKRRTLGRALRTEIDGAQAEDAVLLHLRALA